MAAERGWARRRHHRSMRRRRNPGFGGLGIGSALKNGAIGAAGTLAINAVANQVSRMVGFTGYTADAVELAGAVVLPALLKKFLKGSATTIQTVATGYVLTKVGAGLLSGFPVSLSALKPASQPFAALYPAAPMGAEHPAYEYDLNGA